MNILYPDGSFNSEYEYILKVVFGQFYGISVQLIPSNQQVVIITDNEKSISIDTTFFKLSKTYWLEKKSMPLLPLQRLILNNNVIKTHSIESDLPVFYGNPKVESSLNKITIEFDIFGSIFFMLSRYEEFLCTEKDHYDRYMFKNSIMYKEGLIYRPIVNEYLDFLWSVMIHLWPNLQRVKRKFKIRVSCDVDRPLSPESNSFRKSVSSSLENILLKRAPLVGIRQLFTYFTNKAGLYGFDPNNTFDWIMEVNERAGNTVLFNFMSVANCKFDGTYNLESPFISQLLRKISQRGHKIGIHFSYNSINFDSFKQEYENLLYVLKKNNISQDIIESRQHYLRWNPSDTAMKIATAGIKYDSTLGFADFPGFRTGICYEYPMYDLIKRKELSLIERPLIIMDQSLISSVNMGLTNTNEILSICNKLIYKIKQYNGDCSLLWHNSSLPRKYRKLYKSLISS